MERISCALCVSAALGVAGAASAQSSITISGVVDVGVTTYQNEAQDAFGNTAKTSKTALTQGNMTASRLVFRGQEDLGGGLGAAFFLDAAVFPDDGTVGNNVANSGPAVTGMFNRRSTVSLVSRYGEIRLGRDYTPTYWNDIVFDPFAVSGVGTSVIAMANGYSSNAAAVNGFRANTMYSRASNSIGYLLPSGLGGLYGQVMYAFNEQTKYDPGTATPNVLNNSRAGGFVGGRVGYASGALDVAAAYSRATLGDAYYAGLTTALDYFNVGATYDFKIAKLYAEYTRAELKTQNDGALPTPASPTGTGFLLGATVPVGVGLIRVAYSQVTLDDTPQGGEPKASKWAIGYVHNLSKRTALYTNFAQLNNKGGYDLGLAGGPGYVSAGGTYQPKSSRGYELGIRHTF